MKNTKLFKALSLIAISSVTIATLISCGPSTGDDYSVDIEAKEVTSENSDPNGDSKDVEVDEKDAEEENAIFVDYQFISEDEKDLKVEVPKEITQGGKTYVYTGDIEYQISEQMSVIETTMELQVEDKDDAKDTITFTSEKTGMKYVLSSGEIVWSELQPIMATVTEVVEYDYTMNEPKFEEVKDLTFTNRDTLEEQTIEGKLVNKGESENKWVTLSEPIKAIFERDASDYNEFGTDIWENNEEYSISVNLDNAFPSWDNWEQDVLYIAGLDNHRYKVKGARWTSDKYYETKDIDGKTITVEVREAAFDCEGFAKSYWAEYEGKAETMGYKTVCTYYQTVEQALNSLKKIDKNVTKEDIKDDISVIYKVKATAKYIEK